MRMHPGKKGAGGRVSCHAMLFSGQSYQNQVMKSFADSEEWGEVIMGEREAT